MKIDRLIGILSLLLQHDNLTAPILAEKFEVSKRTIQRDIESLCCAGIPIVTRQGVNGGISIMNGYKMDKTLLTTKEMQSILTGLKGLDSISGGKTYEQLIDKLSMTDDEVLHSNEYIMIDLSSWYKSTLAPKIELIQTAIGKQEMIEFLYYSHSGESKRRVHPYRLIFKWASWYVWGYCESKREFRLFKLNRMDDLKNTLVKFNLQTMPYPELNSERIYPNRIHAEILFHRDVKWRLIEEFGKENYKEQEDGSLLFRFDFSSKQSLFDWLITFGTKAQLYKPDELREEFAKQTEELYTIYHKERKE